MVSKIAIAISNPNIAFIMVSQSNTDFSDDHLYGSHARGESRSDSDIDVLIVLRGNFDYFKMVEKTSHLTAELSLENDTVISCVFVTLEDYNQRRAPLLINIRREGILV